MSYIFECKCGHKIGLGIRPAWVVCKCGREIKTYREVDANEFRKEFPIMKRRKRK